MDYTSIPPDPPRRDWGRSATRSPQSGSGSHFRVELPARPVGHLVAPQRLGPALRLPGPRRGQPRRQPSGLDGVGSHPNDSDIPRSLNPSAWCITSVRTRTSSDSPVVVSVKARPPPTSIPAPVSASPASRRRPTSTLGVRGSRPPPSVKPRRALERRAHPRHPRLGGVQPAGRAVEQIAGRAHPERVGLERQREPAPWPASPPARPASPPPTSSSTRPSRAPPRRAASGSATPCRSRSSPHTETRSLTW